MKLRIILLIITFISILASCITVHEINKNEAEKIIIKYTHALMRAYKMGKFDKLKEITTNNHYNRVVIYIQAYTDQGEKIIAELKELNLKDLKKIEKNRIEVITSESWLYEKIDHKKGTILFPKTIYHYTLKYELIKEKNNKWKIANVVILNEKRERINERERKE